MDGTVYFITNRNPVDYVLHPAFLRFVVVTCVFYALLRGDGDVPGLTGWPFLAIWALVLAVILMWLAICGVVLRLLLDNGVIRQVWTPLLLLPLNLIIEASVQGTMHWIVDQPFKPWSTTFSDLVRDFTILLLMDILHGHYVVARHPHASHADPNLTDKEHGDAPAPSPEAVKSALKPSPDLHAGADPRQDSNSNAPVTIRPDAPAPVAATAQTPAALQNATVRIGKQIFGLTDILVIRIEEHYLSITTRHGRSMQRAKLGTIDELHNGDLGIQIHRSVWVAFQAIRDVQPSKNGQILLSLVNGDEELVAKARVYAFRQAYRLATAGTA